MIWISIILEIIQALPAIINIIKEIIALIEGHPLQLMHEVAFKQLLADYHASKDGAVLEHGLKSLRAQVLATKP